MAKLQELWYFKIQNIDNGLEATVDIKIRTSYGEII